MKRLNCSVSLICRLNGKKERQADALFEAGFALVERGYVTADEDRDKGNLYKRAEEKFNQAAELNKEFPERKINCARSFYGAGFALVWQSNCTGDGGQKRNLAMRSEERFKEAVDLYNDLLRENDKDEEIRAEALDANGWQLRVRGDIAGSKADKAELYAQGAEEYSKAAKAYERAGNKLGWAYTFSERGIYC